eukprot:6382721-Alexandrium_andersonii.AAC.1
MRSGWSGDYEQSDGGASTAPHGGTASSSFRATVPRTRAQRISALLHPGANYVVRRAAVSYTHLRAHETSAHL